MWLFDSVYYSGRFIKPSSPCEANTYNDILKILIGINAKKISTKSIGVKLWKWQ